MDWGFIVAIFFTVGFGIAAIVLALKLARSKKPVWAYKTTKIIGVGTDAPRELKLTFGDRPVKDVYRTNFILFNKGKEAIRKDDVTKKITLHFKGAEILREPNIRKSSKEDIQFSAKQVVKDGYNSVELDFIYLDQADGAVVEVMHTESQELTCTGNIIGAKNILNIGEFEQSRPRLLLTRLMISLVPIVLVFGLLVYYTLTGGFQEEPILPLVLILTSVAFIATLIPSIVPNFRYRKFPRWSRNIPPEPLLYKGESLEAYCVKCRAKVPMANPRTIIMRNGKPAIQGVCPNCGTKMFRIP